MMKYKIIGMLGVMICMWLAGCMTGPQGGAPAGGTNASSGPGLTSWADLQLLAEDARDVAQYVASREIAQKPEKRAGIERLAVGLEAVEKNEGATSELLWGFIEPAIGNVNDPDAGLRILAVKMALRRARIQPGVVTPPEQVRLVAGGVAKGLRQALGGSPGGSAGTPRPTQ